MIRPYLLILSFFVLSFSALAQGKVGGMEPENKPAEPKPVRKELSPYSITIRGGVTQFFGELNKMNIKGMGGISVGQVLNRKLSLNLDYTMGQLGGKKQDFFNSYFVTKYSTLELLGKWNLTEQFSKYEPGKFNVSLYGGLGLMFFHANAYDLTTNKLVRFSNSELSGRNPLFLSSGNPRGRLGIKNTTERIIPVGANIDYKLSQKWKLGMDYRFYFVRSDKVDATSGRSLANPEEKSSYSNTPNDKFGFLSLSLTYRFMRVPRDTDGDGIADDRDRCPDVAGVAQFFGCPDSDGDGIPDYVDRCPNEPGSIAGRGCPDSDGDGYVDRLDECPNVPGTLKGCPDKDGDGIRDDMDACPDVKGEYRFAGCPDTDGDGISDALDLCPTIKGTYANKGCPDTDGDGVNDGEDRCINEKGDAANFGCPVVTIVQKENIQAQIDTLSTTLRFIGATDVVETASLEKLSTIALLMARNQTIRIVIEGHTDNRGADAANQLLSERRAESIKMYIRERGIASERMLTKGFGETQPVADNKTAKGRLENRRVVIKVIE